MCVIVIEQEREREREREREIGTHIFIRYRLTLPSEKFYVTHRSDKSNIIVKVHDRY